MISGDRVSNGTPSAWTRYPYPRALAGVPWYARLRDAEAKLETGTGEREALLGELDELDRATHRIAVPLSYAEELYALQNNIYACEGLRTYHSAIRSDPGYESEYYEWKRAGRREALRSSVGRWQIPCVPGSPNLSEADSRSAARVIAEVLFPLRIVSCPAPCPWFTSTFRSSSAPTSLLGTLALMSCWNACLVRVSHFLGREPGSLRTKGCFLGSPIKSGASHHGRVRNLKFISRCSDLCVRTEMKPSPSFAILSGSRGAFSVNTDSA